MLLPTKMGEIIRNNKQYSFLCFNCGLIFDDFGEIVNHCEGHYEDEKYDAITQLTEFVCADTAESDESKTVLNSSACLPDATLTNPIVMPDDSASLIQNSNGAVGEVQLQKRKRKRNSKEEKKFKPSLQPQLKPNMPQECPICEEWCDDYRHHLRNVHNFNATVFQCYMCRKFFVSSKRLLSHMNSWNHITNHCYHCEMEPSIKHPSDPRRHNCQFCKKWFPNHVEFKIHFKDAHNEDADFFFHRRKNCNSFTCYICEREFRELQRLKLKFSDHQIESFSSATILFGRAYANTLR